MLRFAEFIRKNYQTIIIATVIVGLLLGLWTTAPGKVIQSYSQALTFLMILFISLTITPRQFALVVRQPAAVAAGLILNFLYMPLLCWALARLLVSDPNWRRASSWWAWCRAPGWRQCGRRCSKGMCRWGWRSMG